MHFYKVGGLLVRRWAPAQRRRAMEVWNGDGWSRYPEVDNVLRHGVRLTETQAGVLLGETHDRLGTRAPFSTEEQRMALHDRLRRA